MVTDDSEIEIQVAGTRSHATSPSPMSLYYISHLRAPTQSELMCKQNVSVNAPSHNGARIKEATWFDWLERRECGAESEGICK